MHASQQHRCLHGMTIMHFDVAWHTMHAFDVISFVVDVVTEVDGVCLTGFLLRILFLIFVNDLLTATLTSFVLEGNAVNRAFRVEDVPVPPSQRLVELKG